MKIRRGFVSNSSSSSFCCFTTQAIDTKAQKSLTEEQRALLDKVLHTRDLDNITLVGFESSESHGSCCIGSYCQEEDSRKYELIEKAIYDWKHAVRATGGANPIIGIEIDI